jgi:hypothetical protein
MSLDKDEGLDVCSRWTPGREEGEIAITDVAAMLRDNQDESLRQSR